MTNSWEIQEATHVGQFIEQCRGEVRDCLEKVEHCFAQLSDEDIWWRPFEQHNAIGNIILHLCGNLEQWIINGLSDKPDTRDRSSEFTHRDPFSGETLMGRFRRTLAEVDLTYAAQTPESLLVCRRIQGFDVLVQAAILQSVTHLCGHVQEVIWITRLRLGPAYQFLWSPATPEQGA